MKKVKVLVVFLLVLAGGILIQTACSTDQDKVTNTYPTYYAYPPYPNGLDADGDTWPDTIDCAPGDPNYWQWVILYLDADGDNIPDNNVRTTRCVGLPSTYSGYTTTAPPPLDRCLNDPANTCQNLRPYLEIDFAFPGASYSWTMSGNCFANSDPQNPWPIMASGQGGADIIVGDINPLAVANGYCDLAINLDPGFQNHCGDLINWLPYQCNGTLYSDMNGNQFDLEAFLSATGFVTDEINLTVTLVDNQQGGGNFRINLQTGNPGNGDVNIIATLPVDTDGDGLLNPADNCIWVENPGQEANPANLIGANGLRVGDACLLIDRDNDGTYNWLDPAPDNCNIF